MAPPLRYFTEKEEKAYLLGVYPRRSLKDHHQTSLEELERLADTAGAVVGRSELCELRTIDPATFLGKGKIQDIASEIQGDSIDIVIFDEDLTPTQNRNLEKALGVKVIDRTGLILDIFARRARTREGKLQVELAQLRYLLPRLVGRGLEFSQLAGGIGTRGPGETRLEMDRRKARIRVSILQRELERVRTHREIHRMRRAGVPIPMVALVGYTNAGKSTLMNRLTHAGVLVEDKLFATLDPTVRRLKLPSGREALLADTVGFIRKLPHQLIQAFRATFEEVDSADLLIHMIDISHPQCEEQIKVVDEVLRELRLDRRPVLRVFNKIDILSDDHFPSPDRGGLSLSALKGGGMDTLLQRIDEVLASSFFRLSLILPYRAGAELSHLYRTGRVIRREDRSDGIHLDVEVDEKNFNKFRRYGE